MLYFSRQISNSLVQSGVHSKQIEVPVTNSIPVTATIIRVNEASDWNSSMRHLECSGMAKCGKLNESLA